MSGKPRLFLVDAGPVIALHQLGLWERFLHHAQVIVPAVVCSRETIFWPADEGAGHPIDLHRDAAGGLLRIVCADAAAVAAVLARFDPVMRERIDAGEAEALAILSAWEGNRPAFCTADGAAARAACLLGFSDNLISLEEALRGVGLEQRRLASQFSEEKMNQWRNAGRQMRLRGEGLAG